MSRILPGVIALMAVLLTGLVHGYWTERWAPHEEPARAAARMADVPTVLGDWEGESLDTTPRLRDGIAGYLYRRYVNRQNGHAVTVALFCGRSGPMAVHTPDVCYAGGGYEVGAPVEYTLPAGSLEHPAAFRTAPFFKTSAADRSQLRIFWSWNATGQWVVPRNPRLTFARRPFLYKLYLIREMTAADEPLEADPCLEFLGLLLPELQRCLFPPSRDPV
ncbi:MAG TPA: exosortase-associated EpsI family protein [Gemmataceae bacterium]|nr:exosortase-associated EpsI family protein [Gemmataceae bacterium]